MISNIIDTYNVMPALSQSYRDAINNSKQCHVNNLSKKIGFNPSRPIIKKALKTKYNTNPIYMDSPFKNGNRFIVDYECIESYYKWLTSAVNEELMRLQLEKEVILKALTNEIELSDKYKKYLDKLLFKPTLQISYALLCFNPSKDKKLFIHSKKLRNTFIKKINKVSSQADKELNKTIIELYEYRTYKIKEMLEKYYKMIITRKKLKRRTLKHVKKSNKSNKVSKTESNKVSKPESNKVSKPEKEVAADSYNGSNKNELELELEDEE
jgi:hypothetical protein